MIPKITPKFKGNFGSPNSVDPQTVKPQIRPPSDFDSQTEDAFFKNAFS